MSKIKLKHITIPVKTYNKFKRYAQIADIKMYQLADAAINEYLKNHPLPEEKQNEWIQDLIKTA